MWWSGTCLHPLPSIHVGQPRRSWDFFKRTLPRSGLGGDSQVFQTANHFELEKGGDHREQVEYTSHRVDVSMERSTFQLQFENPRITLKQYMYAFYLLQCVSRFAGGSVKCGGVELVCILSRNWLIFTFSLQFLAVLYILVCPIENMFMCALPM